MDTFFYFIAKFIFNQLIKFKPNLNFWFRSIQLFHQIDLPIK